MLTLLPSIENPLYLDYPLPFLQENLDAIFHDFFKNSDSPLSPPPPPPLQIGGGITLTMQHFAIRSTVYWWFILISGNESLNTHLSNFVSLELLLYADYYGKIPYNNKIIKEKDLLTQGCNSNRTKMEKTWQNMRNLYSVKDSTFSMWQSCLGKV